MAKKAKKRPAKKAAKKAVKRPAARAASSKSSSKSKPKKRQARRAKAARKPPAKRKIAARAAKPGRKAPKRAVAPAPKTVRVTAKTFRQRAVVGKPIRHLVEVDEVRERADAESVQLGVKEGLETDDLAEELGEEFVTAATSGEQAAEDMRDQEVPEERGGPFVVTTAGQEFAEGTDASNPPDAERAALPTSSSDEPD